MPALNYSDSKDTAKEILPSLPNQQSEQSVLTPFSEELSVDEELKLSHDNFKQKIYDFFEDKNITPLSQLTETPLFPTPHVLAQFASKAYTGYKKRETDHQYEKRLDLPDGWKLLTTASNSRIANGYFGAAYWHPEHQQVVIAHRGTNPTNFGALWTDVAGVVFKHHVAQMGSASTFAQKVVEVLKDDNLIKDVNFQLFFTGHSLGGWLSQITTFTTEYLKREGNIFLKSDNIQQSYHPHTVVFDSPGCKSMLSQMTDKFDVRLDGRSIEIEHLDITSYLSAPNRINTCNEHAGTVYRIFTDLSDIGWWKKHTAVYNLATHSMHKIVEAFDPDTGQVRKDEQGKLKVKVVIDWPVSSGLMGGEEYKNFFKGAKHLNDYHQEVTDVPFQIEGYHSIRYQTETYDEGVARLSVFCQEERQFLESYLRLHQLPEFFKPKELFSLMENNEFQKKAEEILRSFEIEKDKVCCTKSSALQVLIPYVKRLLQLFPKIKENTKLALLPDEVRNRVYQLETRRCVERINQGPLDFEPNALGIEDFLRSEQQQVLQLRMVDGDEWTGLIKVYQSLKKTGCLIEGQYTILELERLLTVNQLMDFSIVMQSIGKPHQLLMACDTNQLLNAEAQQTIITILNTIKEKPNIKIFLTSRSEGKTLPSLQKIITEIFGEKFVTRDEVLSWSDITTESQEKLLTKTVNFQGINIALNELISSDSPLGKLLPLGTLMEGKHLQVGKPVPISNSYNECYYIGRTLRHQIPIKQDIIIDMPKKEIRDLIVRTEQLREYVDTNRSHTYTTDDLDTILEQVQHQRVMLISDIAGMGKSTVLTHLSKQIKQNFPTKWVVRIVLNDHTDALKALRKERIDMLKAIEFVSEKLLELKPGFDLELFKQCCERTQKVRIVIMLDGFDEISPSYKDTVIDLLHYLRQTAVEQLWVTTRPHLRKDLEDKLQLLSYTLEPFTEENQVQFLTKFWSLKDWFTEPEGKEEQIEKNKLQIYAKYLIKEVTKSITDEDRQFTGIPLQTRMLAEAFDKEVREFYQSAESTPEISFKGDLLGLYKRFIERKYYLYQEEKFHVPVSNVIALEQRRRDLKNMGEDCQLLALKVLFTEEEVTLFKKDIECTFSAEELTRIGIVQVNHDGKLNFIHRTFAEYYVADCLVNRLTEENNTSEQVESFILKDIFLEDDYRVIRRFVDGFLSRYKISQLVLKQYGNRIGDLRKYDDNILHRAAFEGNANIIGFLFDCVQAGDHKDTIKKMVPKKVDLRYTAWDIAVLFNNTQVLEKLWECAEKKLTTEELKNDLLLARLVVKYDSKDREKWWNIHHPNRGFMNEAVGRRRIWQDEYGFFVEGTVWHVATYFGNLKVLQKLWELGNEKMTIDEIKKILFFDTDQRGWTAWHVALKGGNLETSLKIWKWAIDNLTEKEIKKLLVSTDIKERTILHLIADEGNSETLQVVWEWAKEKLTTEEIKNKLLFGTDSFRQTAWHLAAEWGNLEALHKIREWATDILTKAEINNKLLLGTDCKGMTAWHLAADEANLEALHIIGEWAKENLTTEEISKLYFGTDIEGRTAWHCAAGKNNIEALNKIWKSAEEKLTGKQINNLLLTTDNKGNTAWHCAAGGSNLEALHKIWEWAEEKLTREEINNNLLLRTDNEGKTAWHWAAQRGNLEALHKIWEWAEEKLTREEINNNLLLRTDNEGKTSWHWAAEWGKLEALHKIWEWAKEKLTTDDINNKLLFGTDNKGRTAWHLAALLDNKKELHIILECAEGNITTEEINNKLLLATDQNGSTVWHWAVEQGTLEALINIWTFAKEKLTTEEINYKLLLATDNNGKTAWHWATERGNIKALREIWNCAKENLTTEEINYKLLLATDNNRKTAWHWAAELGNAEALCEIRCCVKEILTTEEINNILLLGTDKEGKTAWHSAAQRGNLESLYEIWLCAEEKLTREQINNLLLTTDNEGKTAWHWAAERGNLEALHIIWEWAEEKLKREEINNNFLLRTDNEGKTAWHWAAERGNLEALHKIWEWAEEKLTREEINNNLLLRTDNEGKTAWHFAAQRGNLEILHTIMEWTEKYLTTEGENNLFSGPNKEGTTG